MKAYHRIGLPPQLRSLYIERQPSEPNLENNLVYRDMKQGHWRLPIHTDLNHEYGTFLYLYDDGSIESITYRKDQGPEIVIIKPKD